MNKREKYLGIGLGATLCASLLYGTLLNALDGSNSSQNELTKAKLHLHDLELEYAVAQREADSVASQVERSLPNNLESASVVYQEYLFRCFETSGLSSTIVTGSSPIPMDDIGSKIQFTVQAEATSTQIGTFLDQFFGTDLLHQINFLSLQKQGGADSEVNSFSAGIEVLVLNDSSNSVPNLEPSSSNQTALAIEQNDLFRRKSSKSETSLPPASLPPASLVEESREVEETTEMLKIDPKETTRLVGIIQTNGKKRAILYDSESGKHIALETDGDMSELGINAKVMSVSKDNVQILINQSLCRLELGNRIAEAEAAVEASAAFQVNAAIPW